MEAYLGGFLVTDGHHNRVLRVTPEGDIFEFMEFGNIVPTGLEGWGNTVYMAEAGPAPHEPADGKVVSFGPKSATATDVASGARLLVDVERGRGNTLFALSQSVWNGAFPGSPAFPDTGALVEVNGDGTFTAVVDNLSLPTSLGIAKNTAFVVTLDGKVWKFNNISSPAYGASRHR